MPDPVRSPSSIPIPDEVVKFYCPVCLTEKPAAWGDAQTTCFGGFRVNCGKPPHGSQAHPDTEFVPVTFVRRDSLAALGLEDRT